MNFITSVIRKPLSLGAIMFFWPPVITIIGVIFYLGVRYWYIALIAFVFLCMIGGTQAEHKLTDNERQNQRINDHEQAIINRQVELLERMGQPENNGRWADWQLELWKEEKSLERELEKYLSRTEVVNLDPLGHKIGRVFKK